MALGLLDKSAIQISFEITGDEEIRARFLTMGDSLRTRVKAALLSIARDIAGRAKASAPRGDPKKDRNSGMLAASIDTSFVAALPDGSGFQVRVRPWGRRPKQTKRNGNYAIGLFVERGLAARRIYNRGKVIGRARNFSYGPHGETIRGRTFRIREGGWWRERPDIGANPFFENAFAAVEPEIQARIDDAVRAAVNWSSYVARGG